MANSVVVKPGVDGKVRLYGSAATDVLVDVLKRLSRWGAVVDFESLDQYELRRQVQDAADEAVSVLRAQSPTAGPRHADA